MTRSNAEPDHAPGLPHDETEPTRRTMLKRAGAVGAATIWAAPAVQSLGMAGAAAQGSEPPVGRGTLSGQVTNAVTAAAIAGATVSVGGTSLSATTDSLGFYTITNVPAGPRNVTASASGFISSTQGTTVPAGGTATLNFALSPANSGGIRAVLSWGAIPSDLDLHASGPIAGGGRFHVYWANTAQRDASSDPYCQLDVDDVNGNGPETQTITISNSEGDYVAGVYRFWVHNYSAQHLGDASFASSGATVNLFDLTSQVGSFAQSAVPDTAGSDSKYIWLVAEFTVDDAGNVSSVTSLQEMRDGGTSSEF